MPAFNCSESGTDFWSVRDTRMSGSRGGEVGCRGLAILRIALGLEADTLALVQGAETRAFDCRDMNEDVLRAVFRRDEAKTLIGLNHLTVPIDMMDPSIVEKPPRTRTDTAELGREAGSGRREPITGTDPNRADRSNVRLLCGDYNEGPGEWAAIRTVGAWPVCLPAAFIS